MNYVKLFIAKFSILLAFALGLVILHEPRSANAVTTLALGDGTTHFDESNNYYVALCNALDVAKGRGLLPDNFDYRYLLQQYPLLEYIDGDNPEMLIDVFATGNGNIMLSLSKRPSSWEVSYDSNIYEYNAISKFIGCGYVKNGMLYCRTGLSNAYKERFTFSAILGNKRYKSTGSLYNLGSSLSITDTWDLYIDYMLSSDSAFSEFNCFNLLLNATNDGFQRIGNSVGFNTNNDWYAVVLSNIYYVPNASQGMVYDYLSASNGDILVHGSSLDAYPDTIQPFVPFNVIGYSVIGSAIVPNQPIVLITPSPVPTQPYSQQTPTPMVVDTGVFGFGGTDVNVSSDYQNVLTSWLDGINKLDNLIFLRVMVDTVLTSNMFSWILIPASFMLIAWVWGLKPFSHKGGDDK